MGKGNHKGADKHVIVYDESRLALREEKGAEERGPPCLGTQLTCAIARKSCSPSSLWPPGRMWTWEGTTSVMVERSMSGRIPGTMPRCVLTPPCSGPFTSAGWKSGFIGLRPL